MLSRLIGTPILVAILFSSSLSALPLDISVNAESALLINAETGTILFEKKANVLRYPASVTKLATALYALQTAGDNLDVMIVADQDAIGSVTEEARRRSNYTVPAYWLVPGASHIGIKKGEELSLRTLLYGLMVASGDDAANVIAQHTSGSILKFMEDLNAYLKEIGCQNTLFYNPHGLHHPKHQTTAHDIALIMRKCLQNPALSEIISTVQYKRPKTNKQDSTVMVQTNRLLRKGKFYYSKTIGGKTGYYSQAGHSLAVAAKDGDRTLIAVLLKCKERDDIFKDATALFEAAFNQTKTKKVLLKAGPQTFSVAIAGASNPLQTCLNEEISLDYYPSEEPKVKCLVYWNALSLPIAKDQQVGELRIVSQDGTIVKSTQVYAQEAVSASWAWAIKDLFGLNGK